MSNLVLPSSIDAGTEIVAAEHQANYVAIRDLINGGLDTANLAAQGVTSREIERKLLQLGGVTASLQPGVFAAGDLQVTAGAGLGLNFAAGRGFITDDGSVHSAGTLLPASASAGSVVVASNASGNPRIDQIILTLTGFDTGTVSVLQGTATVGATLDNRTNAAALPAKSIRLADILVPNGFAGPFVAGTHIRDRRPWARGAYNRIIRASGDYAVTTTVANTVLDSVNLAPRIETSGNPVHIEFEALMRDGVANTGFNMSLLMDGVGIEGTGTLTSISPTTAGAGTAWLVRVRYPAIPAAGSHVFALTAWNTAAQTATLFANASNAAVFTIEEIVRQNASNS